MFKLKQYHITSTVIAMLSGVIGLIISFYAIQLPGQQWYSYQPLFILILLTSKQTIAKQFSPITQRELFLIFKFKYSFPMIYFSFFKTALGKFLWLIASANSVFQVQPLLFVIYRVSLP